MVDKFTEVFFGKDAFKTPDPIYYDRSLLELAATCPMQAKLLRQYENELEPLPELPLAGDIIHKLAEEAIKAAEYGDLQEAADYLMNELPKVRPDLQPEVLKAGRNLAFELVRFSASKILLCEEQITRAILPATNAKGEVLITTCPDLVLATNRKDEIVILDYKTGFCRRTNQAAANAFQTAVICWILFGKYPDVQKIHFWYLETRINNRAYACIEKNKIVGGTQAEPLTQEQAFMSRILETVRLIQADNAETWPVFEKCCQCRAARWCPKAIGNIGDFAKNPKDFLDRYLVLEANLSAMQEVMDEAVKSGRKIIGSAGFYDDSPARKSPFKASFKALKKEKGEENNNDTND